MFDIFFFLWYCCFRSSSRSYQGTRGNWKRYKHSQVIGFLIYFLIVLYDSHGNKVMAMLCLPHKMTYNNNRVIRQVMGYTTTISNRRYNYNPSRWAYHYSTTISSPTTIHRRISLSRTMFSSSSSSSSLNHHDSFTSYSRIRHSSSSSLYMAKSSPSSSPIFEVGDFVLVTLPNQKPTNHGKEEQQQVRFRGIVIEIRGSGWYAVEVEDLSISGSSPTTKTIKCRGGNLEKWNPPPDMNTITTTTTTDPTQQQQQQQQQQQYDKKEEQENMNDNESLSPKESDKQIVDDSTSILSILKNQNRSSPSPPKTSSSPPSSSSLPPRSSKIKPPAPLSMPSIINLDRRMKSYQDRRLASYILSESSSGTTTTTNHAPDDEYMEQCLYHASHGKWIIFSDLHVAPSTLETTLQVLDYVHQVALEKSAGILFLGDFWHHRGTIRIDCLNAILSKLKTTYKVPMICIPGNHDQVTLGLSSNHGLTPLENSYRIPLPQPKSAIPRSRPPKSESSTASPSVSHHSKQQLKSSSSPPAQPTNLSFLKKEKDNNDNDGKTAAVRGRTLPSFLDKNSASMGTNKDGTNHNAATAAVEQQQQQQEREPINQNEEAPSQQQEPRTTITSIPGPLIFSNPTKFGNAFFIPHIRDLDVMESVLQSTEALSSQALFIHADVTGAYMNDMILSKGGISPSVFPSTISTIYSGHFHKPHTITPKIKSTPDTSLSSLSTISGMSPTTSTATTRTIQYVGSPYQTSLSEANQSKELFLVDAKQGWQCVERIPIHIGRKHHRYLSIEEFLQRNERNDTMQCVQPKDRVVISAKKELIDELRLLKKGSSPVNDNNSTIRNRKDEELLNEFDRQVKELRKLGATVEVREVVHQPQVSTATSLQDDGPINLTGPTRGTTRGDDVDKDLALFAGLEEMAPQTTLLAYLDGELHREVLTNNVVDILKKEGLSMLTELEQSDKDSSLSTNTGIFTKNDHSTHLCLDSVDIEGFGPFQEGLSYPLSNRGLVLVRGCNKDGGADSNGSGKTSLAMAALWALTGSVDPRPMQDAKVSDVVNDKCKTAKVSINGTLNSAEFVITRTKSAASKRGASGLSFHLDGEDLSAQSAKDTQAVIDEKLGVGTQVLARTIFHGQHAMNGLLEATDGKLKDELSLIVPLNLWQEAASLARTKSRIASQKAAEVSGMISLRNKDLELLVKRRDTSQGMANKKREMYNAKEAHVQSELNRIEATFNSENNGDMQIDLDDIKNTLDVATRQVSKLESRLQDIKSERNLKVIHLEAQVKQLSSATSATREKLQEYQRKYDRAEIMLDSATANLQLLEEKWNIKLSEGGDTPFIALPDICPTCLQPIADSEDHKHEMREKAEEEVASVKEKFRLAQADVQHDEQILIIAEASLSNTEDELEKMTSELQELSLKYDEQLAFCEDKLKKTREEQFLCTQQYSQAMSEVQQLTEIKSLEASLAAELELVESTEAAYKELCQDTIGAQDMLVDLSDRCDKEKRSSATASQLAGVFGPRGVQTFVLQNAIKALQTTSQSYLDELSDGSQKLDLELDAGERIVRRAFVQNSDGSFVERPLSSLSGGQWRRCSIAMNLGFADLVARRGRMRPSLFVLDEPLTHLDQTGRAQVGKVLRQLLHRNPESAGAFESSGLDISTILIILQDLAAEELEESFDHIDQVVKEGGQSSVEVDEFS